MSTTFPAGGLYAITDSGLMPKDRFLAMAESAILAGASVIQYREKKLPKAERLAQAKELVALCREHKAICLINDDHQLAADSGAQGVHLGQTDASVAQARDLLGSDAIIGVTCHDSLTLAIKAEEQGANYLAFGRFFPSATKGEATPCALDVLTQAKSRLALPIVAIGGITPENGEILLQAGADWLAVIEGIFGQRDITKAVDQYKLLLG